MNNSINFTNHYSYYNGGGSTFNSEFAVNTGFITPLSYTQNAYSFNKNSFPYSLAKLLKNENYSLIICGRGDSEEYVKNMATKDRRIQYLGSIPHDEILQLQRTASLLVNPRTPEGIYTKYSFPSKTMEYLASGTPTLLYELPGITKEYYHYCYSLNDQSITALAEKVDEVLSLSIEERTKLGEKAQQFILDTKNATIQCTKILELIKRT